MDGHRRRARRAPALAALLPALAFSLPHDRPVPDLPSGVRVAAITSNVPARPMGAGLPIAVVVGHREYLLGCHSFERFLDRRWETFFVFEPEFAERWRLRELVRAARPETSRGAHLVELAALGSEHVARMAALRVLRDSGRPWPEVVQSANCDIQPLPTWHPHHVPFPEMTVRMWQAFRSEALARASPLGTRAERFTAREMTSWHTSTDQVVLQTFDRHQPGPAHWPLFFMSQLIVETLPSATSLEGCWLHGVDVGNWKRRHADQGFRPDFLRPGEPWLVDASAWTEDHIVMYNATLFMSLRREFAKTGASILETDRLLPPLMARKGWGAVRHNDLVTFYDLGVEGLTSRHEREGWERPIFDAARYDPGPGWGDWLKGYNLRLLAQRASPQACFREQAGVRRGFNLSIPAWCGFAERHLMAAHVPKPTPGTTVRQAETWLLPLLRMLGWEVVERRQGRRAAPAGSAPEHEGAPALPDARGPAAGQLGGYAGGYAGGYVRLVQLPFFQSRNVTAAPGRSPLNPSGARLRLPHLRREDSGEAAAFLRLAPAGAPAYTLHSSPLLMTVALRRLACYPASAPTLLLPLDAEVEGSALPFEQGWAGKTLKADVAMRIARFFCDAHGKLRRVLAESGKPGARLRPQELEAAGSDPALAAAVAAMLRPFADYCPGSPEELIWQPFEPPPHAGLSFPPPVADVSRTTTSATATEV